MMYECKMVYFFFFQAEDGIRDLTVTGVQTCALPILRFLSGGAAQKAADRAKGIRLRKSRPVLVTEPRALFGPPAAVCAAIPGRSFLRSEEHTSELQSQSNLVCRLLLEKKK